MRTHIYHTTRLFQGRGGGCFLGVPELTGHGLKMLKFENWNLIKNYYNKKNSDFTSRTCNEAPVQSVFLYSCPKIHNLLFLFSKVNVSSNPIHPPEIATVNALVVIYVYNDSHIRREVIDAEKE